MAGLSTDSDKSSSADIRNVFINKPNDNNALADYRPRFAFPGDAAYPEMKDLLAVIPKRCFEKDALTSFFYACSSWGLTFGFAVFAWSYFPTPSLWNPLSIALWTLYAVVEGTIAWGVWVIGHECGHGAFHSNPWIQDAVGLFCHSMLLTPYFSWQRSHAVHHSRVNHLTEGESHVPAVYDEKNLSIHSRLITWVFEQFGEAPLAVFVTLKNLLFGWPVYLMFGATGGPVRGWTNHFIPFSDAMFPGEWKYKVLISDLGVLSTLAVLFACAKYAGSWTPVMVLYFFPYLIVNAWLVAYTWLHHTDVDVPQFDSAHWTWVKGAFATIDREYGPVLDFLHHRIGSTHVAHHICSRIPHYHAVEATNAIKEAFPHLYLYDPTPFWIALWRVAVNCHFVYPVNKGEHYEYAPEPAATQ